jgi:hypothetical protein
MTEAIIFEKARWLRDLARFLPLKSQFVLSGNVRDLQIVGTAPGAFAALPLVQAVHRELKEADRQGESRPRRILKRRCRLGRRNFREAP